MWCVGRLILRKVSKFQSEFVKSSFLSKYEPIWQLCAAMKSWVQRLLKYSELFILFAENSQILLKISVIPILLTFIHLVALNLLVNNQLNSSSNSTHVWQLCAAMMTWLELQLIILLTWICLHCRFFYKLLLETLAEINQILLKMYFIHILSTFMYLLTLYQKTKM